MDDFYLDRKPDVVKLESELILDSEIEADAPFTVSYQEANDRDPSETFCEQTLVFRGKIEVNVVDGLPSIPKPGSSPRDEVTVKVKGEPTEDMTPSPESSIDNSQHFSPALQGTSVFPEELITVKVEGNTAEESDATEENRRHLNFTEGDTEMGVDGLWYKKMSFTSCSEDKRFKFFDFPAFGADVAQKTSSKAENKDFITNESMFLHSEHFPRLSNCKLDLKNGSVIDSTSVSSIRADDTVKYVRKSTAQNYTESTLSEETSSKLCSAASMPRADFSLPDATLSEERPFPCKQCSIRFRRKSDLRRHLLIHSKERAFPCDQCSARFKRKNELKMHLVIHSNQKAFACDECSARFYHNYELQSHFLTHSSERAFSCDQCSTLFKRKNDLRKHLLSRCNTKMFTCDQCSAQFKSKNNFRQHLLTHTDQKFSCKQCATQFKSSGGLRVHLLTHSKRSTLTCYQCSAQCKNIHQLGSHLLEHLNAGASACDQ